MFVYLISTNFSKRSPLKFGFLDVYNVCIVDKFENTFKKGIYSIMVIIN